jgi:tetratricopeptide (TPR) repeat protein
VNKDTARRVRYATGYLQLGMFNDAAAELDAIILADRQAAEVVGVRIELGMERKEWELVIDLGSGLAERVPQSERAWICWAYALRELQRIEEARTVLLRAEPLHGQASAVLHYNLACYYCLLGELDPARQALATACAMHPDFERAAREDTDLKGLWEELG